MYSAIGILFLLKQIQIYTNKPALQIPCPLQLFWQNVSIVYVTSGSVCWKVVFKTTKTEHCSKAASMWIRVQLPSPVILKNTFNYNYFLNCFIFIYLKTVSIVILKKTWVYQSQKRRHIPWRQIYSWPMTCCLGLWRIFDMSDMTSRLEKHWCRSLQLLPRFSHLGQPLFSVFSPEL